MAVAALAPAGALAVAAYRRRRPPAMTAASAVSATDRLARGREMATLATRVGTVTAANRARRVFASAERREALDAELQLRTAEQVATALGQMKGALMKLGQLASFVDESMPEPVRQALAQLQQDAPPMSPELAAEVVIAELGAPPEEVFAEWDPVPIAAASIGQVHRAITRDDRPVAVKVQYPGVGDAIRADLDNLDLAGMAMPFLWRSLDVAEVTEELRARLTEELDYTVEAANQRRFADWYRGHPFIEVPDVVDELSTGRVLTSDLLTGARFDEMATWDQEQRNLAGETIFRFVFRSLYCFHAFNGDPHPGNYLFRPDGRVSFLDYGLVKYFDEDDIAQVVGLAKASVVDRDPVAIRQAAERAGYYVPGAPIDDARVAEYAALFWDWVQHDEPVTITSEYASQLTRRLLLAHQEFPETMRWGRVAGRFVVLQRINVGLVAILGRLHATANWKAMAEELWPFTAGPPSNALGHEEAAWFATR